MLDYRMTTFLKLCETMNYRKAAQELNMTQPGVTQHIQFLEKSYGCTLFTYKKKKVEITKQGKQLEQYARGQSYNEQKIRHELAGHDLPKVRIGATKTIGDYVINRSILDLVGDPKIDLSFTMDNTANLLQELNKNALDFIVIEGFFDKNRYDYQVFKLEPFVGICGLDHPFAGKTISMDQLFEQPLVIREKGSGTRAIFEQLLESYSYSIEHFQKKSCISNFGLIKDCLLQYKGITFAFKAFADGHKDLTTFSLKHLSIEREFNIVTLKNADMNQQLNELRQRL